MRKWLLGGGIALAGAFALFCLGGGIAAYIYFAKNDSAETAAQLYQRTKNDPALAKKMNGKEVRVTGVVARTFRPPGLPGVGVWLEHGNDSSRFIQDRVLVVFVPLPGQATHYKGFDAISAGDGSARFPWSNGNKITVRGTYRYNADTDCLTIGDATLE